ncbi:alkanesulfonate monooxygenase SsuD/methylene tetrahydromethanopterin reductase-like flavin-dependent oxidoreductase (luciferase family) [Nocardioides albertanoniae]|uniref:Alkanesulfonate monooxygenase SsuD/methylene tetrahydromethanopterin reductase-like flavin-dependent oxidoreductase (Luciferase family) n=1 Tax=Nocardioides albertanoniae TaxID=1175486 RepID=A0A543A9Y5_9ACTN|nr:LLM class flavin-dependent oxidoreductase [Nocardioides albertanoniae]TQL69423.1 alkanesulfonate monooxygenase SsuD/methylene tetrahydromethanopterin reductase-like flavin-dependent oxidoreductase (luciferase family) [Nocardioides albertanoniae]
MRFGVALDLGSTAPVRPQLDASVALLDHAEARGFVSAWVGESYHASPQVFHLPASLMVLAHLAARTSLHLGTAVLLLRAYSVERLAQEVALLDQLCEGRLTLGLGLGAPEVSQRTGAQLSGRAGPAFDEALETLRSTWATPSAAPKGVVVPEPAQQGGPRILVGGKKAVSVRRAAELADGFYGATNYTDDLLLRQSAAFWSKRGAGAAGEVATTRLCLVHEDAEHARTLARRHFAAVADYYTSRSAWAGADGPAEAEFPLVGSPDDITRAVRSYAEAGVTSLQLRVAPLGTPPSVAHHTISLVGSEVLPAWRDPEAGSNR